MGGIGLEPARVYLSLIGGAVAACSAARASVSQPLLPLSRIASAARRIALWGQNTECQSASKIDP